MNSMKKRDTKGTLLIVAAPSGGGKTSLVKKLLETDPQLKLSVSYTTRPRRPQEIDGQDYFFVSNETFNQMIDKNAFLEHALVFDHAYGTSSEQISNALEAGLDVILEIDWQGAQIIRELFSNVISIFILPPSYEILTQRLQARKQDSAEIIQARMQKAHREISHCHEFDYVVFNDIFEECLHKLQMIIQTQRLRYSQQNWRNHDKILSLVHIEKKIYQ